MEGAGTSGGMGRRPIAFGINPVQRSPAGIFPFVRFLLSFKNVILIPATKSNNRLSSSLETHAWDNPCENDDFRLIHETYGGFGRDNRFSFCERNSINSDSKLWPFAFGLKFSSENVIFWLALAWLTQAKQVARAICGETDGLPLTPKRPQHNPWLVLKRSPKLDRPSMWAMCVHANGSHGQVTTLSFGQTRAN